MTEGMVLLVYYLLISKSLTNAHRTAKALELAGIAAAVTELPQAITTDGCGYGVKVPERQISAALAELKAVRLDPTRVYRQNADGSYGEIRL